MKMSIKKIVSFVFLVAIMGLPLLAGAQFDPVRESNSANLSTMSFYDIVVTIMKWMLMVITILAVIGFIISGVYFIIGGGSGQAETAKNWLKYSITGIIVALVGYIIVQLVDNLLKGQVTY
jgi:hypothetical protein